MAVVPGAAPDCLASGATASRDNARHFPLCRTTARVCRSSDAVATRREKIRGGSFAVTQDLYGRPLRNLRVSVTDRCNLRCAYCMPEQDYVWLPRGDVLQFEEIDALIDVFLAEGVDKVRLTGGEPLLRRDLPVLVRQLAKRAQIRDLAMTTNGVLLADHAAALREAGLHRLTVSLDTLRHDRFAQLARFDELDRVKAGIATAVSVFG